MTSERDGNKLVDRLAGPAVEDLWASLRATAAAHVAGIDRLASDYLGDRRARRPPPAAAQGPRTVRLATHRSP